MNECKLCYRKIEYCQFYNLYSQILSSFVLFCCSVVVAVVVLLFSEILSAIHWNFKQYDKWLMMMMKVESAFFICTIVNLVWFDLHYIMILLAIFFTFWMPFWIDPSSLGNCAIATWCTLFFQFIKWNL